MKIAIDCRSLGMSGIGVYLENVLLYITQDTSNEFLLIGNKDKIMSFDIKAKHTILPCDIKPFSFKEILLFPSKIINSCDVFYTPNYNIPGGINIPIYSTIHDVVFLDIKGLTNRLGYLIRKLMLKRAFILSKHIFTVSEFSRSRIQHFFGNAKPITVAYNGIRAELLNLKNIEPSKYKFSYLIFVGNMKKYKGLDILLDAIKNTDKRLVVIGASSNMRTVDRRIYNLLAHNPNVILEGTVSNAELYSLIKGAEALIQPSRYEGFGIPPLEALYIGTPVILSDIPVFKEVYKSMPVSFFKDGDSNDLHKNLLSLQRQGCDIELIKRQFSYKVTAQAILSTIFTR